MSAPARTRMVALALTALAGLASACRSPPGAGEAAGYDLVSRFDLATARRETRRIDLGTSAARAFLERGWSWDEADGETTFVWGVGDRSTVRFFLTAARDLSLTLRGGAPPSPAGEPQRVGVSVNGSRMTRLALAVPLVEHRVEVPASALAPGWNRLELRYAHHVPGPRIRQLAARWDWIRLGDDEAADLAPAADRVTATLRLPRGHQLEYYLHLPTAADLEIGELEVAGVTGGRLEVLLEPQGGALEDRGALGPGRDLRVGLTSAATGVSRLVLRAVGDAGPEGLILRRPRVELAGEARAPAPAPGPNVVVYLIDALRADRVGGRGRAASLTPNIDRLAADGLAFDDAIAQSSWTKPAVASLFTGLLPPAHGVLLREHALADRATTLAEVLLAAGYRTAGFSANPWVTRSFGLAQGFLDFTYLDAGRPGTHHAFSDEVHEEVVGWLDRPAGRPFFLYVHTVDPHAPYTPPRADGTLGGGEDPAPVPSCQQQRPLSPRARRLLIERYDEEVAFNDRSFGRLVDELRRRGLYDSSLIVVLSDHGEAFWEHRGWQHENFLYAEVIDIPLVVKLPRGSGGAAARGPVQQIDVLPTVAAMLRLPTPAGIQGRSLVGSAGRPAAAPAFAYLECPSGKRMAAVLAGPWKLIRTRAPDGKVSRIELYDRARDRGETVDLAADRPEVVERLVALLEARGTQRPLEAGSVEVDPRLERTLRALGYVD